MAKRFSHEVKMRVEYMLAERTARYEKGSRSTVMMRLASVTVGLGIAVMIITLAVVAGFRQQINGALRGMMADMTICDVSGLMRQESEAVVPSAEFVAEVGAIKGVRSVAPQVTLNGMAKSGDNVAGLQIKGIDQHYDTAWWQSVLLEGALPDFEAEHRGKELLLSEATARKLDVAVGDKVEMLFAVGDERPRRDRFKVSGIFRTGLEEMDLRMAVGDVRDVRRIVGWADDEVSGYDVMLSEDAAADEVSEAIFKIIDSRYDAGDKSVGSLVANSISERFPVVFDWLKAHSINARVIIVIIMVVVLFNMAAAMLIMVLDRTAMIGSLKALGMRNRAIRRMFLYRAARLFVAGALWGNVVALALVGVQALWHPVELNPSGYMLSELPVRVELGRVVLLNVGAMAVTVLTMLLPSAMIARISPSESLKYKL
ncbi:MAG: ABC transporter permease [Alistipes sp.]|nr:ABC transporter permease [Alistipes sp.]